MKFKQRERERERDTGSGRVKERRRSVRNRTRVEDAIRHFHSAHVIISADRGGAYNISVFILV